MPNGQSQSSRQRQKQGQKQKQKQGNREYGAIEAQTLRRGALRSVGRASGPPRPGRVGGPPSHDEPAMELLEETSREPEEGWPVRMPPPQAAVRVKIVASLDLDADGRLDVKYWMDPATEAQAHGARLLRAILEFVLRGRKSAKSLDGNDWRRLLGISSATPAERSSLLARLQIPHEQEIEENGETLTRASMGAQPFAGYMLRLADGTLLPVIALWKAATRGKKPEKTDPLRDIPEGTLKEALRAAWEAERRGGKALPDVARELHERSFAQLLAMELGKLGYSIPGPADIEAGDDGEGEWMAKPMKNLRDRLKRGGFPVPNQRQRQAYYQDDPGSADCFPEGYAP